jgi:uncharacterized protein
VGPADGQARADQLIEALGLEVLPGESGWWRLITESDVAVALPGGRELPASNTIHLVLSPDRPVNRWHVLESDDVHVLVEGGPVEYVLLAPSGAARRHVLGHDAAAGQTPVVIAAAGVWTALRLVDPSAYAWIVTTVTPAWTPDRARIGLDAGVRDRAVGTEAWLTAALLDDLDDEQPRRPR